MKKSIGIILTACVMAFASVSALASSHSFNFMSNDSTYQATGMFNVSDTLNSLGSYDILGISGDVLGAGGGAITGLVTNPNQPNAVVNYGFQWDNTIPLNNNGVTFQVGLGSIWNLFTEGNGARLYSYNAENNFGNVDKFGAVTIAPVPEPETYAMLLAGLGLMVTIGRRRQKASLSSSMA